MDKISTILPVFNGALFLQEALESILSQSRPPDEVLVVDDGSTDGSADVAASFGGRVTVLRQENQGAAEARNHGIRESSGTFLTFLDADDLMPPDRLSFQMDLMSAAPEHQLIFGMQYLFRHGEDALETVRDGRQDARRVSAGHLAGAMLCRRSVFEDIGLFESTYAVGEFISWLARAQENGYTHDTPERIVLCRRIHGNNMVLQNKQAFADYARLLKASLDRRRRDEGEKP